VSGSVLNGVEGNSEERARKGRDYAGGHVVAGQVQNPGVFWSVIRWGEGTGAEESWQYSRQTELGSGCQCYWSPVQGHISPIVLSRG